MSSGSAGQVAAGVPVGHVEGTVTVFFGAGSVVTGKESAGAGASVAGTVSSASGFFAGVDGIMSVSGRVSAGEPGMGRV